MLGPGSPNTNALRTSTASLVCHKRRPASAGQQQHQQTRKCFLIDSLLEERQKKLAAAAANSTTEARRKSTSPHMETINQRQRQKKEFKMEPSANGHQTALMLNSNGHGRDFGAEHDGKEEELDKMLMVKKLEVAEEECGEEEALPSLERQEPEERRTSAGNGQMDTKEKQALLDALVKLLPVVQQSQQQQSASGLSNGGNINDQGQSLKDHRPGALRQSTVDNESTTSNNIKHLRQPRRGGGEEPQQQMAMSAATAAAASMEFLQRVRLFQQHLAGAANQQPTAGVSQQQPVASPNSWSSASSNASAQCQFAFPPPPPAAAVIPVSSMNGASNLCANLSKGVQGTCPTAQQQMAAALCWQQFLTAAAQHQQSQNITNRANNQMGQANGNSKKTIGPANAVALGQQQSCWPMDVRNGQQQAAAAMLASIGAFRAAAVAAATAAIQNSKDSSLSMPNSTRNGHNNLVSNNSSLKHHQPTANGTGPSAAKRAKLDLKERLMLNQQHQQSRRSSIAAATVTNSAPSSGGSRSSNVKKYRCDICDKTFSRSNTLITHKRIHTGEKPFRCDHCGRAFRQPGNLTRHAYTHTTVKPFVCSDCGKAFNRASNLQTHVRVHSLPNSSGQPSNPGEGGGGGGGGGGHRCVKCSRHFGTRAELRAHKCCGALPASTVVQAAS